MSDMLNYHEHVEGLYICFNTVGISPQFGCISLSHRNLLIDSSKKKDKMVTDVDSEF